MWLVVEIIFNQLVSNICPKYQQQGSVFYSKHSHKLILLMYHQHKKFTKIPKSGKISISSIYIYLPMKKNYMIEISTWKTYTKIRNKMFWISPLLLLFRYYFLYDVEKIYVKCLAICLRLSNQETKNILGRLILKHHFKKVQEDSKLNLIKSDDFIYDFVSSNL